MEKFGIEGHEIDRVDAVLMAASVQSDANRKTRAAARSASKALRRLSMAMDDDPECKLFAGGTRIYVDWFELSDAVNPKNHTGQ